MDLKFLRCRKDLTMKMVAKDAGISESLYCLIENRKRRPSVETAKRIAAVLDFDWTEFFRESTDDQKAV